MILIITYDVDRKKDINVAKEDIAPQEQFLPLPQCFLMLSAMADVKTHLYWGMF
jgi:hypothetical protein